METRKVYQYDEKNYYKEELILDSSDKSPSGSWNIPARCVKVEPPVEKEGYKRKWNGSGWEYEEISKEPEPPEPTLDELKEMKKLQLKAERDAKEVLPIDSNGHSFDYDEKARDRINAAIIAMELQGSEVSIEWTLADNTSIPVTANDLKMVIAAVAIRSNDLHVAYRGASDKVNDVITKEELEKITLL